MMDLNELAEGTSLNLIVAQDINDHGDITRVAADPKASIASAFLAVPKHD